MSRPYRAIVAHYSTPADRPHGCGHAIKAGETIGFRRHGRRSDVICGQCFEDQRLRIAADDDDQRQYDSQKPGY